MCEVGTQIARARARALELALPPDQDPNLSAQVGGGLPVRLDVKSELDRPRPQLVARSVRIFWLLLKSDAVASDPHTDIVAGATLSGSVAYRHCCRRCRCATHHREGIYAYQH